MKSFKEVVAEVKLAYNIADYIQQSGINLKSNGPDKLKGLCPFHNEKSASFVVNENFQNYRCFGCGASGDLISFVVSQENLDFMEAVRKLADDKGIEFEVGNSSESIDYKSLRDCIKKAAEFFVNEFRALDDDHAAKVEVTKRGLSLDKMVYGYAPDGRRKLYEHLSSLGYSDEIILKTGVCMQFKDNDKIFDFWSGRLMFVISDITGKPIGFSGRKLFDTDKRGKYVNSSDGPLFDKSSSLFNISKAKKQAGQEKKLIVVEGQFDVSAYVESDVLNTVASSGTAFTDKQAMICRRLVSEDGEIIFALDGDSAGIKAAKKIFEISSVIHSQSYFVTFPDGMDPADYRQKYGSEKLVEFTNNSKKLSIEFILDNFKKDFDLSSPLGASKYLEKAASALKSVVNLSLREAYIRKVALDAFTSIDTVRSMVEKADSLIKERNTEKNEEPESKDNFAIESKDEKDLSEDIIKKIESDETYNITARLIAIVFYDRRFIRSLISYSKVIPKDFNETIKQLVKIPLDSKIIPESFTSAKLVEYIISHCSPNYNNKEISETELSDLFKYLSRELKMTVIAKAEDRVRTKIAAIIQNSNTDDIDFLEKALRREEEEINKIHALIEDD